MPRINRRLFLAGSTIGSLAAAAEAKTVARSTGLKVVGLRAAQLTDPIGLGDRVPMLSWQLAASRRATMQVAYRIRVARDRAALAAGGADLWDSGRIESADCTGIGYRGAPIGSRTRAWWTVTVWDDRGASATAAPAFWETGLLEAADWTGQWIAAEDAADRADRIAGLPFFVAPAPVGKDAARLFRLPFTTAVAGEVVITLFAAGFLSNVTVDGAPVAVPNHPYISFGGPPAMRFALTLPAGPHMLAAEVTPPRSRVPAKEVSVAAQLRLPQADGGHSRLGEGWQTAMTAAERVADARFPGHGLDHACPTIATAACALARHARRADAHRLRCGAAAGQRPPLCRGAGCL